MQTVLNQMLERYPQQTLADKKNALKEVVQEIALCGLARAGFFREAAFYGGTALRIFYGLDRFSEDLDFSLTEPNRHFNLQKYFSVLENELQAVGLNFTAEEKVKTAESHIKSAFLKGSTKKHILNIYAMSPDIPVNPREVIKIKFEVDTNPPKGATFENKYGLLPSPYQVKLYDLPSLFAGKIHAVICRAWNNRVKGRDLYDYVFYLSKDAPVNLLHLKERLIDSGYMGGNYNLTRNSLIEILNDKFNSIDYDQAKNDVLPFIKNKTALDLWSAEFFTDITKNLKVQ